MKKYFKIHKVFIENGISYLTQYRKDTLMNLFFNILWIGVLFLLIEIIFTQTHTIVGWEKYEVYLLTVVWIIVDEIGVMLFVGLDNLPDSVTDGELDLFITKPANTLFLVSTKYFLLRSVYRLIGQLIIFIWLVWHFDFAISHTHIFLAALLIPCGIVVLYSFKLIANTLSFWLMRIDNVNYAISVTNDLGKYPLNVFPNIVRIISLTAIPIAFSASIPVSILTGKWPLYGALYAVLYASGIFLFAIKFWGFALKRYSSASS